MIKSIIHHGSGLIHMQTESEFVEIVNFNISNFLVESNQLRSF